MHIHHKTLLRHIDPQMKKHDIYPMEAQYKQNGIFPLALKKKKAIFIHAAQSTGFNKNFPSCELDQYLVNYPMGVIS